VTQTCSIMSSRNQSSRSRGTKIFPGWVTALCECWFLLVINFVDLLQLVMFCAAYFFQTIFGRSHDKSSLQSHIFTARSRTCVFFQYWISSPKIQLRIFGRTSEDSEFQESGKILFGEQNTIGSWSNATVTLVDGVIQFQIVAHKTGASDNIHHVFVDNVHLESCPNEGNTHSLIKVTLFSFKWHTALIPQLSRIHSHRPFLQMAALRENQKTHDQKL